MTASKWQCPSGHQPAPGQPSTSTEGWHESADHIRWATDQALAARQLRVDKPKAVIDGQMGLFGEVT